MKRWDVIVIGGGIIGLSLALELRKGGAKILVAERGDPGREASHAAGGMIADCVLEMPSALHALAAASARMYPEFVNELQVISGRSVDLRDYGTILFASSAHLEEHPEFAPRHPLPAPLSKLEPALAVDLSSSLTPLYLQERSVDPRALTSAALIAAKNLGVDISSGEEVIDVKIERKAVGGVITRKTVFRAPKVVNCAGAWAGQIGQYGFPTRPIKGQMLCLLPPARNLLKHVVRSPENYLIPRSDGRIVVGTTVEDVGFDKRTDVDAIQGLRRAAIDLVPELRNARILEDWAGLRPGTPDALPILGATETPGYFAATGHFRDGILLAPITARLMAQVIEGREPELNLNAFSPLRFAMRAAS